MFYVFHEEVTCEYDTKNESPMSLGESIDNINHIPCKITHKQSCHN